MTDKMEKARAMEDRRNDKRLLCAELVEISYQDENGQARRRIVNLEDISLKGACLQMETRLKDGTEVTICYGEGLLSGFVRYCAFRDGSYFLGVQFEGCEWSTSKFVPDHLVDPFELVNGVLERRALGWVQ